MPDEGTVSRIGRFHNTPQPDDYACASDAFDFAATSSAVLVNWSRKPAPSRFRTPLVAPSWPQEALAAQAKNVYIRRN